MAIISVVLGSKKISAAVCDATYGLTAFAQAQNTSKDDAAVEAAALVLKLMKQHKLTIADVEYIGAAVGAAYGCPCAAAETIENATGIPVKAESVINALALGEAYTAGDVSSIIVLRIDEKVEGSIIIDNKVFKGFDGFGGNLAHMVIDNGGFECKCGREGCFEAYVSNDGVARIAADAGMIDSDDVTLDVIFAVAEAGDEKAQAAKKVYIEHLASGITDIINLFQPHQLVIMGPLAELGDALYEPMMEIVLRDQYTRHSPNQCKVRFGKVGRENVLIGAALLGR